jgi:MFS family permease
MLGSSGLIACESMECVGRWIDEMTTDKHESPRVALGTELASLSPNVAVLGIVSLLMGMSSAMIYGLLPVFLVTVLAASTTTVGLIEGIAEATTSAIKIFSGVASDWIGRRKPLVVLGYALTAVSKLLFPLAESASTVLMARVADRVGKGIRDSPRDALLADVTPSAIRGSGFGLRFALYTVGAVAGPLAAIALMALSGDDFRLVFWIALLPGFASIVVLLVGIKESPKARSEGGWRPPIRRSDLARLRAPFWWAISIAAIFSLARFSPAFLVLKAHAIGVDAAFVPIILVIMYSLYSAAAYPFGILADRVDRHLQLGIGAIILVCADLALAGASSIWMTALGAALWGLQMGVTQGLLSAAVADAAPERLRGTAFGIFDLAVGLATFTASAGAGLLWTLGGPAGSFLAGACLAAAAIVMLLFRAVPKRS